MFNYILHSISLCLVIACAQAGVVTPPGPSTLTPSGPVSASRNGQVIEGLRITSTSGNAINVSGYSDVVIKNVEINHSGGHGIKLTNAPSAWIENVNITYTASPSSGQNPAQHNNIDGYNSANAIVLNARLTRGSTGVYLVSSQGSDLSFIEGYDFRGPFPRGQLAQFNSSPDSTLSDFYNVNPIWTSWTEDNVNVYKSSNVTIRRGHIDGNNSPTGVGVMFEPLSVATAGLVEDVDTIRMGNGSFSQYSATTNNIGTIFRRARARENICGDLGGRGSSTSNSLMFASANGAQHTRYEQAQYWASCNGNIAWDKSTMDVAGFTQVNFTMRDPVKMVFSWEVAPVNPLVGHWKFDETSGTTAIDSSANANNGALVNGPTRVVGYLGNAVKFDGVNDAVTIPTHAAYDTSPFTVSFVTKPASFRAGNEYKNILMGREVYNTKGFRFGLTTSGAPVFWTRESGGTLRLQSSKVIPKTSFSHVVVTYDGSVGKMYINEVERASGSGTYVPPSGVPLTVDGGPGGTQPAATVTDDVRWYNGALSATEVQGIY